MLRVKVGSTWLSTIGQGTGPVTVEYGKHGPEAASWTMRSTLRHPLLRGNKIVRIFDGGFCVWTGNLNEPAGDGSYSARGLWKQAQSAACVDGSDNVSMVPDTAVFTAIATNAELTWAFPASLSATAYAATSADLTIEGLLDGLAAELGQTWVVNAATEVRMMADPTAPRWVVPHAVAGRGLTLTEEGYYSRIRGRYLNPSNAYVTAKAINSTAEGWTGIRPKLVELVHLGQITSTRANAIVTGMLNLSGARMGFGETLDLSYGQITTVGGSPAALSQIQNGQLIRLAGTIDTSRPGRVSGYTDIITERVVYTDGSRRIQITPRGYVPRDYDDVLKAAVAATA